MSTSTKLVVDTPSGSLRVDLFAKAIAELCTACRVSPAEWVVTTAAPRRSYHVVLYSDDEGLAHVECVCPAGIQSPPVACKHAALVFALWASGAVPVAEVPHV